MARLGRRQGVLRGLIALAAACVFVIGCSGAGEEPPEAAERVMALVAAGDLAGLVALARVDERGCHTDPSESPQCEAGDVEGTPYAVFATAVCQGYWARDAEGVLEGVLQFAAAPYAVARLGAAPEWARESGWPYGEYVVVFTPTTGAQRPDAVALYLEGEAIVRTQTGCRRADQFLEPGVGEEPFTVIWQAD